jgi:molybdopterin-guanine dinucleotide biosynthesis protein A
MPPVFDALLLAGGAATRLDGADKPAVLVGERTLLQHSMVAVADARRCVVVGPARPGLTGTDRIRRCQEDPPGGGPVAAIAAGVAETSAELVVLLAADMPWVAAAVPALLSALAREKSADAAAVVDARGQRNHLAAAWRRPALLTALARCGPPAGVAARSLYRDVAVAEVRAGVDLPEHAAEDCDTWSDIARARARVERGGNEPTR